METISSLVALIIICLVIVTPSVVLGNRISDKIKEKKSEK